MKWFGKPGGYVSDVLLMVEEGLFASVRRYMSIVRHAFILS